MIDTHSHILPGADDGSEDAVMSAKMLQMLRQQGVDTVVATPHFYAGSDKPETFLQRRAEAAARLPQTDVQVILGAEVAYFDGMCNSGELPQLCLGDSNLLLVEMPNSPWTGRMVDQICDLSVQQGLIPVLAHIERYREQFKQFGRLFAEQGVLFQCNATAFLDWRTRGWALKLMKQGWIHFLGSDCHNLTTRPPRMAEAAAVIEKKLGLAPLSALTELTKDQLGIGNKN